MGRGESEDLVSQTTLEEEGPERLRGCVAAWLGSVAEHNDKSGELPSGRNEAALIYYLFKTHYGIVYTQGWRVVQAVDKRKKEERPGQGL